MEARNDFFNGRLTQAEFMAGKKTWVIVGASRGIGHEFVEQLLHKGERVACTVRDQYAQPWEGKGLPYIYDCDMLSESSIEEFANRLSRGYRHVDHLVLNAGILQYPNRATELSYDDFALHLHTNAIGPIVTAQRLLSTCQSIGTVTFISSDSGSAQCFREMEDGFAAYAASKAALNQMLRHMAAELKRKGRQTVVLALHPGEVATDMANVDLGWEVESQMTPQESVSACISVIESKGIDDSGTFWTWENKPYPW